MGAKPSVVPAMANVAAHNSVEYFIMVTGYVSEGR